MQPNLKLLKSYQTDPAFCWRDFYLDEKRVKLSAKTLAGYRNTINLFIDHLGPRWPPSRADVLGWLAEVEARASRVTACSYWATLRAWLNYLDKVGALAPNPAREIAALGLAPSRPRLAPKGVPAGVVVVLLDHLRASDVACGRDLALIHFLWRTGARSGEAAALTRSMLDLQQRRALIPAAIAKTDEDRTLYFGRKVATDLSAWLEMLDDLDYPAPWVFPSFGNASHRPREQPLTISGIYRMFQRRLVEAGLPRYRVHDLRHSFTKAAMREKIPLSAIQKQLGHATPDMVMHYARLFDDQQAAEFRGFGD